MSKNKSQEKGGTIRKYLTRQSVQNSESGDIPTVSVSDEKSVQPKPSKMAKTNEDIHKLLVSLSQDMKDGFTEVNTKLTTLAEKIESVEMDVENIKAEQENDRKTIESMAEEMAELRKSLLTTQTYSRKYHLLLYGVEGMDTTPDETIKRVRQFAHENLKLDEQFVKNLVIRNAHRLQRRDGPATIIVVFLYWAEREAFLRSGKHLKDTRMSVRTDLPPELKKRRGELAHEAYKMRQDGLQARVREKVSDIWIETRRLSSQPWKRLS